MKLKTFFIILITGSLLYLLYLFFTKPEEKFGEVTITPSKYTNEIKKTPKLVFKTNTDIFNKNVFVYKIDKKLINILTQPQAQDIANIIGINSSVRITELGKNKLYTFTNGDKIVGVLSYGLIQYYLNVNEPTKVFNEKAITELITQSGLNKIVPIPVNSVVKINKSETDGYTSEESRYITTFSITPKIENIYNYRGELEQSLYYGSIKPIVDLNTKNLTGYKIEINTWYSLVFDITDSTTYKTISLDNAIKVLETSPDKIIVELDSEQVHNPVIDTNSLDITNASIVYFIKEDMLIPYYHLMGDNEFNQTDRGIVNIYIPAI